jgi:nitrate reductase molybdenum cofactor assembly chaperone NarJ/NarW
MPRPAAAPNGSKAAPGLRSALAALAPLFCYPGEELAGQLAAARETIAGAVPEALEPFERFAGWAATAAPAELAQTYTTTFDLAPSCPPYLGVHLFAADSPERVRLMVGLRQVAERAGREAPAELPDHLAEVLAGADAFEEEEWRDLARLCLEPALQRMAAQLEATANPYRHLLAAGQRLAAAEVSSSGETP